MKSQVNEVKNFANFHTCDLPYGFGFFHSGTGNINSITVGLIQFVQCILRIFVPLGFASIIWNFSRLKEFIMIKRILPVCTQLYTNILNQPFGSLTFHSWMFCNCPALFNTEHSFTVESTGNAHWLHCKTAILNPAEHTPKVVLQALSVASWTNALE